MCPPCQSPPTCLSPSSLFGQLKIVILVSNAHQTVVLGFCSRQVVWGVSLSSAETKMPPGALEFLGMVVTKGSLHFVLNLEPVILLKQARINLQIDVLLC